jgi:excisionase family DNA binding protein
VRKPVKVAAVKVPQVEVPAEPAVDPGRLLYTVAAAAEMLSLSRTELYAMVARVELQSLLIGHRRRIPRVALERYVERLLALE